MTASLSRVVRALIFFVAFAAVLGVLWMWPPARGVLLYVSHRASICGLTQSTRANAYLSQLRGSTESLSRAIQRVRQEGALELWNTNDGVFWVPLGTAPENFARIMAEDDLRLYGSGGFGVRSGDIVIDCGAAQGTFTRDALQRGASIVVAVEPLPANLDCLRRTFSREIQAGRVIVSPKALSDQEGTAEFSVSQNPYESTLIRKGSNRITVELTTIDRLVEDLGLKRVDFMKVDVEGAERRLLVGAAGTLQKHQPRLGVSVNHLADDVRVLPELILRLNSRYELECGVCVDRGTSITAEVIHGR